MSSSRPNTGGAVGRPDMLSATCIDCFGAACRFVANGQAQGVFGRTFQVYLDGLTNVANWIRFDELEAGRLLPSSYLVHELQLPTRANPVEFRYYSSTNVDLLSIRHHMLGDLSSALGRSENVVFQRDLTDSTPAHIRYDGTALYYLDMSPLPPFHAQRFDWYLTQRLIGDQRLARVRSVLNHDSSQRTRLLAADPHYDVLTLPMTFLFTLDRIANSTSPEELGRLYFSLRVIWTFAEEADQAGTRWRLLATDAVTSTVRGLLGAQAALDVFPSFMDHLRPDCAGFGSNWENEYNSRVEPADLYRIHERALRKLGELLQ
ncbi:hypothetical protein JCM8547_007303, partial [Rhodosporidiobolus lusitaniae]